MSDLRTPKQQPCRDCRYWQAANPDAYAGKCLKWRCVRLGSTPMSKEGEGR